MCLTYKKKKKKKKVFFQKGNKRAGAVRDRKERNVEYNIIILLSRQPGTLNASACLLCRVLHAGPLDSLRARHRTITSNKIRFTGFFAIFFFLPIFLFNFSTVSVSRILFFIFFILF